MPPVFVSDIFPGSKYDADVLKDSGILALAKENVQNCKNSQVCVHVDRVIRRIKVFRILPRSVSIRYVHLIPKLWKGCGKYVLI